MSLSVVTLALAGAAAAASPAGAVGLLATAPVQLSVMLAGAGAAVAYGATWVASRSANDLAVRTMWVAWGVHAVALLLDILGLGDGARFGFAPALSATVWLVVGAHAMEQRALTRSNAPSTSTAAATPATPLGPMAVARRGLAVAGIAVCLMALIYPGELRVAESPWAPLHWLLGIVSYGLFGAAVVHAWLLDRAERRMRGSRAGIGAAPAIASGMPLMMLERLTFRFVTAGFLVLTLAIVLGAWFATQSAAGWRWDHKTVFSLLGWLTFALVVAGRQWRGWRGHRATRWVYFGAVLLLLGYVGSRFVFEVVLGRAP
jgi:ABC-type uncharacterized transport system permease subunit